MPRRRATNGVDKGWREKQAGAPSPPMALILNGSYATFAHRPAASAIAGKPLAFRCFLPSPWPDWRPPFRLTVFYGRAYVERARVAQRRNRRQASPGRPDPRRSPGRAPRRNQGPILRPGAWRRNVCARCCPSACESCMVKLYFAEQLVLHQNLRTNVLKFSRMYTGRLMYTPLSRRTRLFVTLKTRGAIAIDDILVKSQIEIDFKATVKLVGV